jgi:hypothetical protein
VAAKDTRDVEISEKCAHLRPFSLSKSGIRAYAGYANAPARHSPALN